MAKKDIEEFLGISLITIKKFSSDMGSFSVTYEPSLTPGQTFYQDSISILKEKNTLKGMHLQAGKYAQSKQQVQKFVSRTKYNTWRETLVS